MYEKYKDSRSFLWAFLILHTCDHISDGVWLLFEYLKCFPQIMIYLVKFESYLSVPLLVLNHAHNSSKTQWYQYVSRMYSWNSQNYSTFEIPIPTMQKRVSNISYGYCIITTEWDVINILYTINNRIPIWLW